MRRKPEVSFMAPTYSIGGSNSSLTRQGGFNLRQVFMGVLFQVRNVNNIIEESGYRPCFAGYMINWYWKVCNTPHGILAIEALRP